MYIHSRLHPLIYIMSAVKRQRTLFGDVRKKEEKTKDISGNWKTVGDFCVRTYSIYICIYTRFYVCIYYISIYTIYIYCLCTVVGCIYTGFYVCIHYICIYTVFICKLSIYTRCAYVSN